MEQNAVDGYSPLTPPSAEIAQAYLDQDAAVRARREDHLDRRELARFGLAEAVVLPLYLTAMLFTIRESTTPPGVLMLIAALILWMQLYGERRESLGLRATSAGAMGRGPIVVVALLAVSLGVGVALELARIDYPWPLRLVPGAVALVVLVPPSIRELRSAPPRRITQRATFTPAARWATAGVGAVLSFGIAAIGSSDALIAATAVLLVLLSIGAWWFVGTVGSRVPVLGALWRWPQWAAFGVAGGGLIAAAVTAASGQPAAQGIALVAAVACAAVFAAAALIGAPDER